MAKEVVNLTDKGANGLEIEQLAQQGGSYLEAVIQWLEENSIDITQYPKYVPRAIIDKLTQECLDSDMLRPSLRKAFTKSTLDFLM